MKKIVCGLLFGALSSISAQQKPVRAAGPQSVRQADSTKKAEADSTKKVVDTTAKVVQQARSIPVLQPPTAPFVKHVVSQEELAIAIEQGRNGDMSVLNLTAEAYTEAMNASFKYLRLENRKDLAAHIRSLEVVSCPTGKKVWLARLRNGLVDLKGWERDLRPGEQCLGNPKTGQIELSLWCGNPTQDYFFRREPLRLEVAAKPELAPTVEPRATPQIPLGPAAITIDVTATATTTAAPHSSFCSSIECRVAAGLIGTGIVVAGVICVVDKCWRRGEENIHITNINNALRRPAAKPTIGFHFAFKTP